MRHHLLPLACASLLACALPTQAADIGSASSSLSNLRLSLVDLDLNDGIDPSLTWINTDLVLVTNDLMPDPAAPFYGNNSFIESNRQSALPGDASSALPWASTTVTSPSGARQLSIGSNQFSAQSTLSTDQLVTRSTTYSSSYDGLNAEGQVVTVTTTTTETGTSGGGDAYFETPGTLYSPDYGSITAEFQLSPNTLLVLRGTATASVSLDLAALRALAAADGVDVSASSSAIALARAGIMLAGSYSYTDGYDASPDGLSSTYYLIEQGTAGQTASVYTDMSVSASSADPSPRSISKDFAFTFANANAQAARSGYLLLDLGTSLQQFHGTLTQATTIETAIPEPATYALMGLGLVGITLVRRRRT